MKSTTTPTQTLALPQKASLLRSTLLLGALSAALLFTSSASAVLISDAAFVPEPMSKVTFDQFTTRTNYSGGIEVSQLPGESITLTATSNYTLIGTCAYGLDTNGQWSEGDGLIGLNTWNSSMMFTFNSGPVATVGGFFNYTPDPNLVAPFIEVLDKDGSVLERYCLSELAPISTPGAVNQGSFRGISRNTADISAFRIGGSYIVIDDLEFSRTTSPVPDHSSTFFLMGIGALGVFMADGARRRKAPAL